MKKEEQKSIEESPKLFERYRFVADEGQSPLRIDKFLINFLEKHTSRNKIQNAAKAGNILVNNKAVKPNYKVKPKDVISVLLPEPQKIIEIIPEDIPLVIEYEDEDLIIVNKSSNMVVHPGYANYTGTLLNALTYHLQNQKDSVPLLVHRIDKNTTGLMVIAKNELAQSKLAKQFFEHTVQRDYEALVWGDFDEEEGVIEGHVGRHPKNRKVMTVFPDGKTGRHAKTHYKVLERFGYVSLVQCRLETGRTHQIRIHMKYIKHPLFGDYNYGGDRILKGTTFSKYRQYIQNCFKLMPHQSLHAKTLGFIHPRTGEFVSFTSDFPQKFKELLEKWRNYAKNSGLGILREI